MGKKATRRGKERLRWRGLANEPASTPQREEKKKEERERKDLKEKKKKKEERRKELIGKRKRDAPTRRVAPVVNW